MTIRDHAADKKAVLYARVSSDEQEKEGYSIPAQEKLLAEYARAEGIDVVEQYVDVETAKKAGRSSFAAMVEFLQEEMQSGDRGDRCRTVLVEKTDRLYRNLKDYVTLDELDIDIHFVKEGSVISPDSHSSQKFLHGIKVLMAKNYVDNLSEETKKGLQEKALQGIWPMRPPIGYQTVVGTNGKKIVEPNPKTAPIVAKMFEHYATGNYSLEAIRDMARAEGVVSPRSGRPIHRSWVHRILSNRIYYGEFMWNGRVYPGSHQPLVSRDLWDKVQRLLSERGVKKPKTARERFAFSGLLTCTHCGCSLVGEIKKEKYIYYHCTGARGECPKPYTREEVIEQQFCTLLGSLRFDDEILAWVREALMESHADERQEHEQAIERLQSRYAVLRSRLDTMYVDKLDGRIDADFYDAKAAEFREEQSQVRYELKRHESANASYMDEGVQLLELANNAVYLFKKQQPAQKRELLKFVVSNCSWDGETLVPEFRQPFDMIADAVAFSASEKAAGGTPDDLCRVMGG